MPPSRIVIAGPPSSGKRTLCSGLELLLGADAAGCSAPPPRAWHLRTRYYTASLAVSVLPGSAWAGGAPVAAELEGAEALVLVLDATAPEDLAATASAWARGAAAAGVGTLLCVTNKADVLASGADAAAWEEAEGHGAAAGAHGAAEPSEEGRGLDEGGAPAPLAPELPAFAARVAAWCLDVGFEHVHASAARPRAGGATRDKYGLPRVLEALECTMWGSMERLGRTGGGGDGAEEAGAEEEAEEAGAVGGAAGTVEEAGATGAASGSPPSAPQPSASPLGDDDTTADAILRSLVARARQDARAPTASAGKGAGEAPGEEEEDEEQDGVERLMSEMARVRESSRQTGTTDAQRREAASRVAMQLLALIGGGDAEEEGEGEEGESA